jgi:excisionase family DNA binding protein
MERRLLDITEAADYLNLSTSTLYSWVSQRRIPHLKLGGRVRFDKKALDRWIKRFERNAIDDHGNLLD